MIKHQKYCKWRCLKVFDANFWSCECPKHQAWNLKKIRFQYNPNIFGFTSLSQVTCVHGSKMLSALKILKKKKILPPPKKKKKTLICGQKPDLSGRVLYTPFPFCCFPQLSSSEMTERTKMSQNLQRKDWKCLF